AVMRRGFLAHATVTGRRGWFAAHPYDESVRRAEDRELFVRAFDDVCARHLAEPLYFLRDMKATPRAVADYVASSRDNRRIFRRHGSAAGGALVVGGLLLESLAKEAVFRALGVVGAHRLLVRRRGREITRDERAEAERSVARIRATAV